MRSPPCSCSTAARPFALTFSTGVAVLAPTRPSTIGEIMAAADAHLYDQKQQRRRSAAS